MKLYHWTAEKNLLGIATGGLQPFVYDNNGAAFVSAGRKVVWLTSSDTRTPTAADIEWLKSWPNRFDAADVERFSKILFGDADAVRLTVKFNSSNSQRLKKAMPWLRQFGVRNPLTGEVSQLGRWHPPSAANYFVHLGVIPPSQIELPPITARVALLGLKDDAPQREQLKDVPPDTLIDIGHRKAA